MIVGELRSYIQHIDDSVPVILVVENESRTRVRLVLELGGRVVAEACEVIPPLGVEYGRQRLVMRGQYRGSPQDDNGG